MSHSSPKQHTLKGESFQKALERYCDENKPDPLVLKQIQGWEMEWKESTTAIEDLSFQPTDVLQGTLTWKSDYMVVELECSCCWEPHPEEEEEGKPKAGSLYFAIKTKLRFRSKHDNKTAEPQKSKEEKKSEEKIRTKMIKRLKEDAYIKRLLQPDSDKKKPSSDAQSGDMPILCEARIRVSNSTSEQGQLEERVNVTDNVAEGLRRAVFSQVESALDVVEVLLSLPLLPGSAHAIGVNCPLADRAKLRLLEDAMFDACEREGEDELIDDLKISPPPSADDSEQAKEGGGRQKQSKTQQQPQNRSNKRTKR